MSRAVLALSARTFASLRKHRNYRLFFLGQVVSLTGTWMQNVALAWFVVELTRSPVAVGVLAFFRFVPFTVFGLFAGVLADRFDNRRLLIATQGAAMGLSAVLAALALTGAARLWHVYVLAALLGSTLVFDAPGRHTLTFRMVGRDELPNAVALNASLFNASRIVGPSVAGVLVAVAGVGVAFAINAVSFLAVLTALLLMREEELFPVERAERPPTLVRGVGEAWRYVRRSRRLQLVLGVTLVVSTVGVNFHVLVPVLAAQTLRGGSVAFGFLSASFGAGALAGALLSASLARASLKAMLAGTGGFGVSLLLLAPQSAFAPAAALLFLCGICFTLWNANGQSVLQLAAPDHLRGRVLSFYLFAFAGTAPIGGLLAGWLSEIGGTQLAFAVAGGCALAMTLIALATHPSQARLPLRTRA
ncbi:MAG: MFS transporter [Thermoleophilia bacterium]|nr:MFS transporter [Thermoleophilia bacterium]